MNKINAVIFDMDGVLIDAKEWHYEALNRALGLFGYSISRIDHRTTFDGLPTKRKLEILTLERGLPRGLQAFINDLKQLYTVDLIHRHCKPTFVHEYALSNLKKAGYRLAVASNSVRHSVELMMEKSSLRGYIELLLSNEDVNRAKPDPEIYQIAMRRLGVQPSESLIVEDNPIGIQAAQHAGAHVMVVQNVAQVTLVNIRDHIARAERGAR